MMRFTHLLASARRKERPPVLIASLPRNDPALARAALEGGADVVKLHLNLTHRASQTHIGSLVEERPALEDILKLWCGKPVGIVPGNLETINAGEVGQLAEMGFDFLSLYLKDAPVGLLPPSHQLERMLALSHADPLDLAASLDALDLQICELSIMAPETYGQPLTQHDLARYAAVRRLTQKLLVVPSQHKIPPQAAPELAAMGIEGIMLGSIVCGATPQTWFEAFKAFKNSLV